MIIADYFLTPWIDSEENWFVHFDTRIYRHPFQMFIQKFFLHIGVTGINSCRHESWKIVIIRKIMWHFWYNDPSNIDPCQNTKPSLSLHGQQWSESNDKMKQNLELPKNIKAGSLRPLKAYLNPYQPLKKENNNENLQLFIL